MTLGRLHGLRGDRLVLEIQVTFISTMEAGITRLTHSSWLSSLRSRLQSDCQQPFEFALVTEYPSASASLGLHKDDEPEIVSGSTIACISDA